MLGKVLIAVALMFAGGAVMIVAAQLRRHTPAAGRKGDWVKFGVYAAIVSVILVSAWAGRWLIGVILALITIAESLELHHHLKERTSRCTALASAGLAILAVCYGHLLVWEAARWFPVFAFVFLLVSISDSFAQLWGRLLGQHRLCPQLSPGKTWEGLIGGFGSTIIGSLGLSFLVPHQSVMALTVIALLTAAAATTGDLTFSWIKRKLGIKDFSGLLPGHGGVLDRFDSLTLAAPVFYWSGKLLLK